MTNGYFNHDAPLARHTLARAEELNAKLTAVAAGFDRLPPEAALKQGRVTYAAAAGTMDSYAVTLPYVPAAYTEGMRVTFSVPAGAGNGGASAVNVNGLGAKPILRIDGGTTLAGDLPAGGVIDLCYDGIAFRLTGAHGGDVRLARDYAGQASASASAAAASQTAAGTSAATAAASATTATAKADAAVAAASAAAASAAGVGLPAITPADAGKVLAVNSAGVLTLGSAGIVVKKNTGTTISSAVNTLNFTGTSFDVVNSGSGVVTVNFGFLPWRYFRIEAMTASHPPRPSGSTYYNDIREIRIFLSNDGSGPNQALGRVVTVSASAPEYNTTWINDGNDSTRWASPLNATSPPWVTFDFGEAGLTTPPASCVIVPAGYDASFLATQVRFGVSKDGMAGWLWSPVYSTSTIPNVAQFFTNIVYS